MWWVLHTCYLLLPSLLSEGLSFTCAPKKQGSTEPTLEHTALARGSLEGTDMVGTKKVHSFVSCSLLHPWKLLSGDREGALTNGGPSVLFGAVAPGLGRCGTFYVNECIADIQTLWRHQAPGTGAGNHPFGLVALSGVGQPCSGFSDAVLFHHLWSWTPWRCRAEMAK